MNNKNFYDLFHKDARVQHKIISESNFTYSIILARIKEIIENKKRLEILDFGCGVGTISLYLASKGHRVTGIDVSSAAVQMANRSSNANKLSRLTTFYVENTGKRKMMNNKFDFILCTEVLEHLADDKKTIKYLADCLKKNGRLLISVPSVNAPLYKLGLLTGFDKRVGHLRRYSLETISELVNFSKLEIIEAKKTEGVIRNALYTLAPFTKLVRLMRWPVSNITTFIDTVFLSIFGESDIFILARKV